MIPCRSCALVAGLCVVAAVGPPLAAMSVTISTSVPSAPAGAIVRIWSNVSEAGTDALWHRFRTRRAGGEFRMVRDFGPESWLDWSAGDEPEGTYEIELTVRNLETGDTAQTIVSYETTSRVLDGAPVISATANPLVFLYSAPPCDHGSRMRVEFRSTDGPTRTPYKDCGNGSSMNFYLAGLRANELYVVKHSIETGEAAVDGPELELRTPEVSLPIAAYTVHRPPASPETRGILLQSMLFQISVATDLMGNVVWFYPVELTFLTRPSPGGRFFGIIQNPEQDVSHQILREFDLTGATIRETNAARVSEQLEATGRRGITSFHHEAARLPDGKIVVLASNEQILTDVQGEGPVDVLGEAILVLDDNLEVVWSWDAFDHLDVTRLATLGETCTPTQGGCPPFYQASKGTDWLHANAVTLTPDGNFLVSLRHQDWLIKIDYANGQGSGGVIWRLGKDGDFQAISSDPEPWFSHQHDALLFGDGTLTVYDNSNLRFLADGRGSRGQVWWVDEVNRVAELVVNADLGGYSAALGSAQRLPNGNYHFDSGFLPGFQSRFFEVNLEGNIVYEIQVGAPAYRSFRMTDLYGS